MGRTSRPRQVAGAIVAEVSEVAEHPVGPTTQRSVEVVAGRFPGWVERFGARHGGAVRLAGCEAGLPVLRAADGAVAMLDVAFDEDAGWVELPTLLAHVARVGQRQPYALLLLRRGGWAVARCEGERVLTSKVGTRYVQGRTKKGGSSQQRYARRRGNQARAVVAAAVAAAPDVWGAAPAGGQWCLVTGGDRPLLAEAVQLLSARLTLSVHPRVLDVPDPRRAVLDAAARSACAVRVLVRDAPG